MTMRENNLEFHAAAVELINWLYLGTTKRHRTPDEDHRDVQFKIIVAEGDNLVL